MRQRGVIHIPIILIVLLAAIAIGTTVYLKSSKPTSEPEPESSSPTTTTTPEQTEKATPSTSSKTSKTPSPTPIPLPASSCSINALTNKDNPNAIDFYYAVNSQRGTHMVGAQWDFDGNGSWDTDMSQSNGTITHTYSNSGTYTAKLKLKMSDGEITNVCSKQVTVPQGITVKLTGHVYEDKNCNDMREPDEGGIGNVTINLFWMPDYYVYATITSDANGYYSYSKNISPSDSLYLKPSDIAVYAHKIYHSRHAAVLNSTQKSINLDLGQVPAANIDSCY